MLFKKTTRSWRRRFEPERLGRPTSDCWSAFGSSAKSMVGRIYNL